MKKIIVLIVLLQSAWNVLAQEVKPKLVVGIIIDQMRHEYLNRYVSRFGENGFKRFLNEGFSFDNMHFNYIPTYTGPGHAAVYTGATPATNGIIGNYWFDKRKGVVVYCAGDDSYTTVGADSDNGQMSPKNMLTTTITDQLRLSTQMRSKVIGLSIKDRGAIFPAGHMGSAFWHDKDEGKLITSSYYSDELPKWVADFNKKNRVSYYLKQTWDTKYPIETYINSGPDDGNFESDLEGKAGFPYNLKKLKAEASTLPATPFGNDFLTEAAIAAINNAGVGDDEATDFLVVSYSSTDYVGHAFGPKSVELEDTYLRLDDNISELLTQLDDKVGKGNYTVFITADHAVADIPQQMMEQGVPAGRFSNISSKLNSALEEQFAVKDLITKISNEQIFLDYQLLFENELIVSKVKSFIKAFMLDQEGIMYCYTSEQIEALDFKAAGIIGSLRRGFHQKRSGDLLYVLDPAWLNGDENSTGTSHGSGYTYDTHVPLLWYGKGIKEGNSVRKHSITQIAPTLSMLLKIALPNGAFDEPLYELFED